MDQYFEFTLALYQTPGQEMFVPNYSTADFRSAISR